MNTITVIYHDPGAPLVDAGTEDGQYMAFYVVTDNDPVPWDKIKQDLETLRQNLRNVKGNGRIEKE